MSPHSEIGPFPRLWRFCRCEQLAMQEHGQALIEMALSLTLVLGTVFLVLEFSLMAYTYSVMNDAAREGVRYAIVHGTGNSNCSGPGGLGPLNTAVTCGDTAGANVQNTVINYAASSLHTLPATAVTVGYPDGSSSPLTSPMPRVTVTITYQYVPFIRFPGTAPTMTISSVGRIVN